MQAMLAEEAAQSGQSASAGLKPPQKRKRLPPPSSQPGDAYVVVDSDVEFEDEEQEQEESESELEFDTDIDHHDDDNDNDDYDDGGLGGFDHTGSGCDPDPDMDNSHMMQQPHSPQPDNSEDHHHHHQVLMAVVDDNFVDGCQDGDDGDRDFDLGNIDSRLDKPGPSGPTDGASIAAPPPVPSEFADHQATPHEADAVLPSLDASGGGHESDHASKAPAESDSQNCDGDSDGEGQKSNGNGSSSSSSSSSSNSSKNSSSSSSSSSTSSNDGQKSEQDDPDRFLNMVVDSEPAPRAKAKAKPRPRAPRANAAANAVPRARVNQSPVETLLMMTPSPHCVISLNLCDHRFVSKWQKDLQFDAWTGELRKQHFTRSFNYKSPTAWKDALRAVHERVWTKHRLVAGRLPIDIDPQTPGDVPAIVFEQLANVIATLPEPRNYTWWLFGPCDNLDFGIRFEFRKIMLQKGCCGDRHSGGGIKPNQIKLNTSLPILIPDSHNNLVTCRLPCRFWFWHWSLINWDYIFLLDSDFGFGVWSLETGDWRFHFHFVTKSIKSLLDLTTMDGWWM